MKIAERNIILAEGWLTGSHADRETDRPTDRPSDGGASTKSSEQAIITLKKDALEEF